MEKPHVVMVPCPAQGHVVPLMELAQYLAKHEIRITFVNTEFIHQSIIKTFSSTTESNSTLDERIRLVSIPDGLDSKERSEREKLVDTVYRMLPGRIQQLVEEINGSDEEDYKVTCIIYDQFLGKCQECAKKLGIRSAAFHPAPAADVVLKYNIQKLMEDGIIDSDGSPIKNQVIQLGPSMPIVTTSDLVWTQVGSLAVQKLMLNIMMENNKVERSVDWLVCNSVYELEPGAFGLLPELVPIGPLLASNRLGNSAGHLWEQDFTCLNWLEQQKDNSVIYIAFGSSTKFNSNQFQELALGLELTNRPFLWAVRYGIITGDDATCTFPEGFLDRVSDRGMITGWAPQQKVLSHPSVTCFLSHCGWNSTLEGVSNGVPLLCWPYQADQFMNRSYICDVWRTGLAFDKNSSGIITSEEIKNRVDQLLGDDVFKERAMRLKERILISAQEGGNSYKNLTELIKWIKG